MGTDEAPRRRSGELSQLVRDILREHGRAMTAGEVQHLLAEAGSALAYTTVVTILSRLHEQGALERFRTGHAYAYLAVTDSDLAARRMRRVLDAENDRDAVLASFVHDLSPGDEQRLRELLGELDTDSPAGTADADR